MLLALLLAGPARADVVDRILHVVDERVVTASDVAFEAEVDPHDRSPIPELEDPAYPYEWRLVDYALLREQARDVEVFRPRPGDLTARVEAFRESWESPAAYEAFLARWGLTEADLEGWFYSRLVVERFIQRNLSGARETTWAEWMAGFRARAVIRSPDEGE